MPVYAIPSSLSITASIGSSSVGDTIRVFAYYTDNASNTISYADCSISGGFLSNTPTLTYSSTGLYHYYDFYLSSAGSSTFSVSCSKTGYDSASGSTTIEVPKGSSTLSVYDIPVSGDVGGKFTVRAEYRNSNSKISGATCKMDATAPSGAKDTLVLSEMYDSYTASYSFSSAGSHLFEVSCSSGNYQSHSSQATSQINKKSASIQAAQSQSSFYAEQLIDLNYYYRESGGVNIYGAQCSYELRKGNALIESGKMLAAAAGYRIAFSGFDYTGEKYALQVSCEASEYQKQSITQTFSISEIPAETRIEIKTPNGDFSHAPISISALYRATNGGKDIAGASCTISFSDEKTYSGTHYETTYPSVEKSTPLRIQACCSKKNYANNCINTYRQAEPQLISAETLSMPLEFVAGGAYLVGVRALPAVFGDPSNITCRADAIFSTSGEPSKTYALERTDSAHSAEIFFEKPGSVQLTYTCSGIGYETYVGKTELRVKVFKKESENTLFTVLGALGVLLTVALIIITRKYKV